MTNQELHSRLAFTLSSKPGKTFPKTMRVHDCLETNLDRRVMLITYNLKDRCRTLSFVLLPSLCMFPQPVFVRVVFLQCNMACFLYRHLHENVEKQRSKRISKSINYSSKTKMIYQQLKSTNKSRVLPRI